MTDRPIIFRGPMVRALLGGRKTQDRRVLKPQPCADAWGGMPENKYPIENGWETLPYATGDRLYVREAWRPHYLGDGVWDIDVSYPADGARRRVNDGEFGDRDWNWPKAADRGNVTPRHMPRWASRLTLTVTDVRVQRLHEISRGDAMAEGCPFANMADGPDPRDWFRNLWNSLHGPEAWDANPWVVALTFTGAQGNIDAARKMMEGL